MTLGWASISISYEVPEGLNIVSRKHFKQDESSFSLKHHSLSVARLLRQICGDRVYKTRSKIKNDLALIRLGAICSEGVFEVKFKSKNKVNKTYKHARDQ